MCWYDDGDDCNDNDDDGGDDDDDNGSNDNADGGYHGGDGGCDADFNYDDNDGDDDDDDYYGGRSALSGFFIRCILSTYDDELGRWLLCVELRMGAIFLFSFLFFWLVQGSKFLSPFQTKLKMKYRPTQHRPPLLSGP